MIVVRGCDENELCRMRQQEINHVKEEVGAHKEDAWSCTS